MEMYRGYESKYEFTTFMVAFEHLTDAMNFCVATQVSLLHVQWPIDIVKLPQYALHLFHVLIILLFFWFAKVFLRVGCVALKWKF